MGMRNRLRSFTLTEVLIAVSILAVGILPVVGLYTSNTRNIMTQKEEMISAYIAKRVMETIKQFNANSAVNYDLLDTFNVADKPVVDNTAPGEIFANFEDLQNPPGFADEPGISSGQYPELYEQMKDFSYRVIVRDYNDTFPYNNFYGTGVLTVTVKEVEVRVRSPHRNEFTYSTLMTRSGL